MDRLGSPEVERENTAVPDGSGDRPTVVLISEAQVRFATAARDLRRPRGRGVLGLFRRRLNGARTVQPRHRRGDFMEHSRMAREMRRL